jgi:hypothetical protein
MKKLLLFTVLALVTAALAVYTLELFNNIVHGTLYHYGLHFSYEWANPYWTLLRIVQISISLTAVLTVVNTAYVYRRYVRTRHGKPMMAPAKIEKKVAPLSVQETEAPSETQKLGGMVRCTHCNRVFAQPLRMLDFHSDRPRIISICPFCNEVIQPILRNEEAERGKRFILKGKKNDQAQRKEETNRAEEAVTAST